MGIEERRNRERALRRESILTAAWHVAEEHGYSGFSLEKVAAKAEIGRATVYSYFDSIDDLLIEMGRIALAELEHNLAEADGIIAVLDVPVRLSQKRRSHFDLLFPQTRDPRPHMNTEQLLALQDKARNLIGRIGRIAQAEVSMLPEDAKARAAFLAGVSMAGAAVPELHDSTTLRHQWQNFCLGDKPRR